MVLSSSLPSPHLPALFILRDRDINHRLLDALSPSQVPIRVPVKEANIKHPPVDRVFIVRFINYSLLYFPAGNVGSLSRRWTRRDTFNFVLPFNLHSRSCTRYQRRGYGPRSSTAASTFPRDGCHPYPNGVAPPFLEYLRSSGIDGIFKRAPNARTRKSGRRCYGVKRDTVASVNLTRALLRKPRRIWPATSPALS